MRTVPSAASLYVPHLPDIHNNDENPLHIYAGYLPSDPNALTAPDNAITAHLYFVLVKARRTADRERVIFWFNVRSHSHFLLELSWSMIEVLVLTVYGR